MGGSPRRGCHRRWRRRRGFLGRVAQGDRRALSLAAHARAFRCARCSGGARLRCSPAVACRRPFRRARRSPRGRGRPSCGGHSWRLTSRRCTRLSWVHALPCAVTNSYEVGSSLARIASRRSAPLHTDIRDRCCGFSSDAAGIVDRCPRSNEPRGHPCRLCVQYVSHRHGLEPSDGRLGTHRLVLARNCMASGSPDHGSRVHPARSARTSQETDTHECETHAP